MAATLSVAIIIVFVRRRITVTVTVETVADFGSARIDFGTLVFTITVADSEAVAIGIVFNSGYDSIAVVVEAVAELVGAWIGVILGVVAIAIIIHITFRPCALAGGQAGIAVAVLVLIWVEPGAVDRAITVIAVEHAAGTCAR